MGRFVQALIVCMGLPIGLMLWHWRDLSVRQQIENSRKDTTLKEFSELQLRAAGALDEKLSEDARLMLQVAALHQLRPYLRGESGSSFRLTAFEFFCSMLDGRTEKSAAIQHAITSPVVPKRVYRAVRDIISEEWESFFHTGFSFTQRSLRGITLPEGAKLKGIDFRGSDLSGFVFDKGSVIGCLFQEAILDDSVFSDIDFLECKFERASAKLASIARSLIQDCKFIDCDLERFNFFDSTIYRSEFECANLSKNVFRNVIFARSSFFLTNLSGCEWQGAKAIQTIFVGCEIDKLTGLRFDRDTIPGISHASVLGEPHPGSNVNEFLSTAWTSLSEERCAKLRGPWLKAGAARFTLPSTRSVRSIIRAPASR